MKSLFLHFVASTTLFFYYQSGSAQTAPDLSVAGNFVLFSSNGALNNAGVSFETHLTGDVGKDGAGTIIGFGNVNGIVYDNVTTTHLATTALLLAYAQLIAEPSQSSHAPALGNETLAPGAYSIATAATLNGILILDGQLQPNSVFIINIGSTFNTTAGSQVILINDAKACNVFWTSAGNVTLNAGTIKGTIIANNAAININPDVSLEGRALSIAGPVNVNKLSAIIPTGCGRPALTGPTAPDLFSTACYALFSSSGNILGDFNTHATGDIGSDFGTTSDFDAQKINGTVHLVNDNSTEKCADDLIKVRDQLDILPTDIVLSVPTEFGHDLLLTPHTYLLNGAASLTGNVFLDAQGNADAIFVIKVIGAFSTNIGANVVLLNQAKAGNVFWRVTGAASLEQSTDFKGTVICTGGAISLKAGATIEGRALTTDGEVSTDAAGVDIPAACSTLPVSWLYFRGRPNQNKVLLEWGTAKETDNSFFTIEKSRNGSTFETLSTINTLAKNTNGQYHYIFIDREPYSLGYYRISQTDNDGRRNYFQTLQVKVDIVPGFNVLRYIKGDYIYVQTSGGNSGIGYMELYNLDGRKTYAQKIILNNQSGTFKIEKPFHKGLYFLYIQSNGEKLYGGKVMVQ